MQNGHVLIVPGTRAGFADAFVEFRRALDTHALGERARYMSELVFEEIVTNIIRHGYADAGEHVIRVSLDVPADSIVLCFEDDGVPFDPRQVPVGPIESAESRLSRADDGGRGLLLVGKAASHIEYERTADGQNRLTVTIAS
jgi:serine/threonine-protein kinase RsbW